MARTWQELGNAVNLGSDSRKGQFWENEIHWFARIPDTGWHFNWPSQILIQADLDPDPNPDTGWHFNSDPLKS